MKIKSLLKKIMSIFRPPQRITVNIVSLAPTELLKGRTALITGGTSGIGRAIAEAFVKSGADVVITGRNAEKIKDCVESISKVNTEQRVYGIEMDNTEIDCIPEKFKEIQNALKGPIDILVNNVGVNCGDGYYCNETEYNRIMDTNLKSTFFLTRFFSDYLIKNNIKGNILNIASSSSLRPASSPYIISKWGIRGLTIGFAKKLIRNGIVVNGIAPGPTYTPMLVKQKTEDYAIANNPSGRYVAPEEVANMAVVLTSGLGRMVVGDIVYITGGAGVITVDDIDY